MFEMTEEQFNECEQAEREKHDEKVRELAEQRAEIFQQSMESCHSNNPIDCIEWFADRIIELEAENEQIKNSDTLCKVIGEQKRKITDLEAQIEKMKCCENCGWFYLQQHWRESKEINESRMFHCGTCGNKKNWKLKEIKEK